ncbi:MAG: SEC-C metal-binding domain-containing protein, partial [Pseudomonadota bacterium]
EAQIIAEAGVPGAVTIATNMAGRGTDIQLGGNFEMRCSTEIPEDADDAKRQKMESEIQTDIDKRKQEAIAAGGLYVIGTERHESRRIDNQLRGRSGRQGDPGHSKFFLSLQDDLMRIFGSERMDGMLKKLGLQEDESIVHPWINKALERAQKKVEARNFDIRKNLLKFDDVMNDQRKVIFDQRKDFMRGEELSETITDMRHDLIEDLVARHIPEKAYPEQWNTEGLQQDVAQYLNLDMPVMEWAQEDGIDEEQIIDRLTEASNQFAKERSEKYDADINEYVEKSVMLQTLDHLWREHLLNLDHLRSVVGFRGYAQRDPLQEYKSESFELFEALLANLRQAVTAQMMRVEIVNQADIPPEELPEMHEQHQSLTASGELIPETDEATIASWGKVGRNAPCPCGSGLKFKHCHGRFA